jgi:hypothetical protein
VSSHAARRAAAAIAHRARQQARADPRTRGADWRTATVSTVNSTGTIVTSDGITARRLQSYRAPAVGDQVIIHQSGSGNWICPGRLATTNDGWTTLSLSGSWSAWGSPYNTPAYHDNRDGTVSLCGLAKAPASTTGASTVCTLPSALWPASKARFTTEVASGVFAVLDVNVNGTVQINDYAGTASWAALDMARYRLA